MTLIFLIPIVVAILLDPIITNGSPRCEECGVVCKRIVWWGTIPFCSVDCRANCQWRYQEKSAS